MIDEQQPKKNRKADEVMNWTQYHTLDTIYEWIDSLEKEFPEFITVQTVQHSYENRPIKLVKLSKKQVGVRYLKLLTNQNFHIDFRTIEQFSSKQIFMHVNGLRRLLSLGF